MNSIWTETCALEPRSPLPGDRRVEIAVIGAGMAGVLIARALQDLGRDVIILEANRLSSGQTRNTTAKLTSQHGMIYSKLIKTIGMAKARQYAAANEAALAQYRHIIEAENIDCDLESRCAYLYGDDTNKLRAEAQAAAELGLPACFVPHPPLPFPCVGAVRFDGQAQFHPLKFLNAVAAPLTIYEKTPVRTVDDHLIFTDCGKVQAEKIVFACHYPIINVPGLYFARMHQERSYVIALKDAAQVNGMWLGADGDGYSLRNYREFLLLGGGGHRTGENREGGQYAQLLKQAKTWFPHCHEVARWSAQDCITADGVPYIGRFAASRPDWYVATGFHKWGMTSSMVSAMLLRDLICGKESPYAQVFHPGRFPLCALPGVIAEGGHAVKGLTKRLFQIPEEQAAHLPRGHGGVVFFDGEKIGVYKDENGKLYPVNLRCPHLGCQLEWNPEERTWDCPCHGSRFDRFGHLISGPAQENLCR